MRLICGISLGALRVQYVGSRFEVRNHGQDGELQIMLDLFLEAQAAIFQRDELLRLFVLEKALYELNYEINNRPDWLRIPLAGILRLVD